MRSIITLAATLLIAGCNSIHSNSQISTLPDTLQVGHSILSRDTAQAASYPVLTAAQCRELADQTGYTVPDSSRLIGMRHFNDEITIAAYQIPTGENPNQFKVYLVAHVGTVAEVSKGHLSRDIHLWDNLDLGEFHTSEYQGQPRFGGNRFYTTDAELRFDGNDRFTVHRVMTLTSLYLKDHRLTEQWRVEWDNHYRLTEEGRFYYEGQQETLRTPADLDDPVIDDYQSRDRQDLQ